QHGRGSAPTHGNAADEGGLSSAILWQLLSLQADDERTCVVFLGRGGSGSLASMAAHRLIATALASEAAAESPEEAGNWVRRAHRIYCITFDSARDEFCSNGLVLNGTAKFSGKFLHVFPSHTSSLNVATALGLPVASAASGAAANANNFAVAYHASPLRRPQHQAASRDGGGGGGGGVAGGGGTGVGGGMPGSPVASSAGGDYSLASGGSSGVIAPFSTALLGVKAVALAQPSRGATFCIWPSLADESPSEDSSSVAKMSGMHGAVGELGVLDTAEWEAFQLEVCAAAHGISFAEASKTHLGPRITAPVALAVVDGCFAEVTVTGENLHTTETALTALLPSGKAQSFKLIRVTSDAIVGTINLGQFVTSSRVEEAV
ncbi:MAG: hypothetical protein Q8J97_00185, partial [Flavobacteriaceae bacterium]|nr:hypothetical protein [Flavobacteriaceae bacterium]